MTDTITITLGNGATETVSLLGGYRKRSKGGTTLKMGKPTRVPGVFFTPPTTVDIPDQEIVVLVYVHPLPPIPGVPANIAAQMTKTANSVRSLMRIDGDVGFYRGSFHDKAADRFDACTPGDVFRYRNIPLTKLTDAELQPFVGRTYKNGGMDL